RDNMRIAARGDERFPKHSQQSQGRLNYAIVDEVDNILIDEARTPLIISGPAEDDITKYQRADKVARGLKKDEHFEVKEKEHNVSLTEEGVRAAEKLAGVESFYTAGNMQWPHLIDNSLKAHYLYKRDVNYVVNEGRVVIVDEFTGRLMEGRQWSDGLHQAVEAKEGVPIKQENQTLATITLQNFFKLYKKLSGMTGTALTEAGEFWKIYKLDVVGVPTNKPLQRDEQPDVIYRSEKEKYNAIADEIERLNKHTSVETKKGYYYVGKLVAESDEAVEIQCVDPIEDGGEAEVIDSKKRRVKIARSAIKTLQQPGRPILVGTVSIEKSERLAALLNGRGVPHEVLNAKQHGREAQIVAQAGRLGAVTIATNMAGRGTDIILGGNPETMAWSELQDKYESRLDVPNEEWDELIEKYDKQYGLKAQGEEVKALGGLRIIGTERHEARRIDLQLRGRCGRQGDPGSSRFYLSLEDDLMRIFAGEWVRSVLTRLGMQEGEAIESKMVSRRIEGAQKKVEERNFEIRKNLLEYDEVMDEQRKRVYSYRQRVLDGENTRELIAEMIGDQIDERLGVFLEPTYGIESFAAAAGSMLGVELEAKAFKGMAFEEADQLAHDEAVRAAEGHVLDAIEENLPPGDEEDWNWGAMTKWANTRYALNLRDRDLKKVGRDMLDEHLIEHASTQLAKVDLSPGARLLEPSYPVDTARAWLADKFGVVLTEQDVADLDPQEVINLAHQRTVEAYDRREGEYAVMAALQRFGGGASGQRQLDREGLIEWAQRRLEADLSIEDIKNKQRDEVRQVLVAASLKATAKANEVAAEAVEKVDKLFDSAEDATTLGAATGNNGKLDDLAAWLRDNTGAELATADLAALDRAEAHRKVSQAVENHFRPEMRRMERELLLQIVDTAWKDHLRTMQHLRESIGLRGYAQVDPKVEYKREGMRLFEQMWDSTGAYVTDLIFKMEQLDEGFVGSTWVETEARHDEGPSATDIARSEQQGADAADPSNQPTDQKLDPIRNTEPKVGRNQPCPCGSGKKYKHCYGKPGCNLP
ncbi:MAG: SEC-C metal-binding domain-containing protein, partial [Planctomycetota bacterium]